MKKEVTNKLIESLEKLTNKKVKLVEKENFKQIDISLSDSFDDELFNKITSKLKSKGFIEGQDFEWWIARGDDMPHGVSILNPAIVKTNEFEVLKGFEGDNVYS